MVKRTKIDLIPESHSRGECARFRGECTIFRGEYVRFREGRAIMIFEQGFTPERSLETNVAIIRLRESIQTSTKE